MRLFQNAAVYLKKIIFYYDNNSKYINVKLLLEWSNNYNKVVAIFLFCHEETVILKLGSTIKRRK